MGVVYVQRSGGPGSGLLGVYLNAQPGYATEQVSDTDPQVLAFRQLSLKRSIRAILADVQALTGPQQTAVWADVTSGTPPKWQSSNDPVVWAKASQASLSNLEKQVAVAFFVRENVGYLVNPVFAPTINIPGDVPA